MKIHFIGIGGIGISALSRHFILQGEEVTGSDISGASLEGVKIFNTHKKENIEKDTDLVIYSPAVKKDNPEIISANEKGIKIKSYPEALGNIAKQYYTIAVSGTHGKSTTTAMIAVMMISLGFDPTVFIGTKLKQLNDSNYRKGKSKYMLIEADEFKSSFLNYHPDLCVITNIEEDHLDYYKDIKDIKNTFKQYLERMRGDTIIANKDDKNTYDVVSDIKEKSIIWYTKEEKLIKYLSVPGEYNLYNATAAFSVIENIKGKKDKALTALKSFKGSWRRFEEKEVTLKNGKKVTIINDYAHHPTEIRVTIDAVKDKYKDRKIIVILQPHQYERCYRLFDKFINVLSAINVDKLMISDIFTVEGRESEDIKNKVSSLKIASAITDAIYSGDIPKTAKKLLLDLQGNEVVVIMGAGSIYRLENLIAE